MQTATTDEILRRPYAWIVVPDPEGTYSARILEFDGCFSGGETAEEALTNLREAAELWLEAAVEAGQAIPEPLAGRDYSGRLNLRLPPQLHEQAAMLAALEGVSLNQLFVTAIAREVGRESSPVPPGERRLAG